MIQILLAWLYIYTTSFCAGKFFMDIITKRAGGGQKIHPVLYSLCGLGFITVIAGYLSVFLPTGLLINILLTAFSVIYILVNRKKTGASLQGISLGRKNIVLAIFVLVAFALVLVKAAGPVTNPDSGAYHLPLVKWIEDYRAIKGIANVHTRFGFNYQYLVLCAVYGFSFLGVETVHSLNGYLMILFIGYVITSLDYYRRQSLSRTDIAKLVSLFLVINMSNAVSSFSPDFPATVMTIIVILITLERIENGTVLLADSGAFFILVLSIVAFLFKISAFPIGLFSLFFLVTMLKKKEWKTLGVCVFFCLVAVIPYLVRNYIISGYLVYPLYSLDIFNVPWKVPLDKVIVEKEIIRFWALGYTDYRIKATAGEMLVSWVRYLKTSNASYIYLMGLFFASAALSVFAFIAVLVKKKLKAHIHYVLLYLLLYLCLFYWAMNAPDPRFGNGFIIPFIGLTAAIAGYMIIKKYAALFTNGLFALLIVMSAGMLRGNSISKVSNNFNEIHYNFLYQEPYPVPEITSHTDAENRVYYLAPCDKLCWEAPQPCSYCNQCFLYIGRTIEDGFVNNNDAPPAPIGIHNGGTALKK